MDVPHLEPESRVQPMGYNVLVICSDQHQRDFAGCYGHSLVQTPNLDRLAASGCVYTNAYAAYPCCVSTRASMQTGRWVHDLRTWSSAEPYDGTVPGWGHQLQDAGRDVISIGKLHFRSSTDNNGFAQEMIPVHVVNGIGFASILLRDLVAPYESNADFATAIGRGESSYTRYDREICSLTCDWLENHAAADNGPWTLFCSFVAPHHPVIAPGEFYDLYDHNDIAMPRLRGADERPRHPVIDEWQIVWDYDRHFHDDDHVREVCLCYHGLVSSLDHNIGKVLQALEASGAAENTVVVYTSDHGELLGNHGMWAKMNMYEESVAIPMIAAGPGIPAGTRCNTPASHVDLHPTILKAQGLQPDDSSLPGIALQDLAAEQPCERAVLSEYHERGAITGMFMMRWKNWKYVAYPGYAPQLFDMENDSIEEHDLGGRPDMSETIAACDARLREIVDPDAANRQAFADQAARVAALGGREAVLGSNDLPYTPMPG